VTRSLLENDQGWVKLNKLLEQDEFKNYTEHDVLDAVLKNNKKRFLLSRTDAGERLVRAEDGHSVPEVRIRYELLDPEAHPIIYYGATYNAWEEAKFDGLKRSGAVDLQFSKYPFYINRKGKLPPGVAAKSEVKIAISSHRAMSAGCELFETASGMVVCRQNVPAECFEYSEDARSGLALHRPLRAICTGGAKPGLDPASRTNNLPQRRFNMHKRRGGCQSYFTWAKLAKESVDALMLIDTGSRLPSCRAKFTSSSQNNYAPNCKSPI
jgi:RNA:NAD 2'-phosphotransferase (TPT1/KptA family)